jgi:hypothetical protein
VCGSVAKVGFLFHVLNLNVGLVGKGKGGESKVAFAVDVQGGSKFEVGNCVAESVVQDGWRVKFRCLLEKREEGRFDVEFFVGWGG